MCAVTVGCLSISLSIHPSVSHQLTAAAACVCLAAEYGRLQQILIDSCTLSRKCGEHRVVSRRMRLNLYLFYIMCLFAWFVPSVLWHCWLGGRKGIRPVKNWVVGCWHGYLFAARCRLAYGPADATATHCLLLQLNPDWFYLSGTGSPGYSPGQRAVKRVCVAWFVAYKLLVCDQSPKSTLPPTVELGNDYQPKCGKTL